MIAVQSFKTLQEATFVGSAIEDTVYPAGKFFSGKWFIAKGVEAEFIHPSVDVECEDANGNKFVWTTTHNLYAPIVT